MHNLNVLNVAVEMIFNRIFFTASHLPFAILFGIAYVFFAWYWYSVKGFFFYYFLDYNCKSAVIWYIGLLSLQALFFSTGSALSTVIATSDYAKLSLLSFAFCVTKIVMRPVDLLDADDLRENYEIDSWNCIECLDYVRARCR